MPFWTKTNAKVGNQCPTCLDTGTETITEYYFEKELVEIRPGRKEYVRIKKQRTKTITCRRCGGKL